MAMTLREPTDITQGGAGQQTDFTEAPRQDTCRRAEKPARRRALAQKMKPKGWDPRERFPELDYLPFVRYLERPAGEEQCDWWHIQQRDRRPTCFADYLLGKRYARLTLQFMASARGKATVLEKVLEAMSRKGDLHPRAFSHRHSIAYGFISEIGRRLRDLAARDPVRLPYISRPYVGLVGLGPRSFIVHLPEGNSLVCDPDRPIQHNGAVAITRDGQFLCQGIVKTKHPAKAKTVTLSVDTWSLLGVPNVGATQWSVPSDCAREDIAPIVATQTPEN